MQNYFATGILFFVALEYFSLDCRRILSRPKQKSVPLRMRDRIYFEFCFRVSQYKFRGSEIIRYRRKFRTSPQVNYSASGKMFWKLIRQLIIVCVRFMNFESFAQRINRFRVSKQHMLLNYRCCPIRNFTDSSDFGRFIRGTSLPTTRHLPK